MALHLVDDEAGLSPAEEQLVMRTLSHVLGEMSGWRTYTYNLCRIVAAVEGLDVRRNPSGQFEEVAFSSGKQVMLRLDLTPRKLDGLVIAARRQRRPLQRDVLVAFFPERLWPTFARIASAQPESVIREAREVFSCWASGSFSNGEPRPGRARAASNVQLYIAALWLLMRCLCDLREVSVGAERDLLRAWTRDDVPKTPLAAEFDAEEASRDRSAPPLLAVRRAMKAIDSEIARKKRYAGQREHIFLLLRDRAMFALLALIGMRAEAMWSLDVDHFEMDHVFPDGSRGPALIIPPVKRERVAHAKGLPTVVAEWLAEYLDWIEAKPGEPMWRPPQKKRRHERLAQQSITDMLIRRLSPFCDGRLYSPHTLRHLAAHLATLVGIEWIRDRPTEFLLGGHGMPSSPQTFADVLLGQALHNIADRYRDMNSKPNREMWTRLITQDIWQWLWGDKGARKGPDLKLITDAEEKAERCKVELRGLEATLDGLEARAEHAGSLTEKEGIVLIIEVITTSRQLAKASARYERALRALDEARAIVVPIDDAAADVPELTDTNITFVSYDDEERPLVRMLLLPDEFRFAVGTDLLPASTLRRWMSGKLPHPAGDPRNLFDPPRPGQTVPDAVKIASNGGRKRYIRVDQLDPARYHADAWERILELCRRPEPKRTRRNRTNDSSESAIDEMP